MMRGSGRGLALTDHASPPPSPPPTATARSWRPTSDVEDAQGYASAAGGRALQRQQLAASS